MQQNICEINVGGGGVRALLTIRLAVQVAAAFYVYYYTDRVSL